MRQKKGVGDADAHLVPIWHEVVAVETKETARRHAGLASLRVREEEEEDGSG